MRDLALACVSELLYATLVILVRCFIVFLPAAFLDDTAVFAEMAADGLGPHLAHLIVVELEFVEREFLALLGLIYLLTVLKELL